MAEVSSALVGIEPLTTFISGKSSCSLVKSRATTDADVVVPPYLKVVRTLK